MTKPIGNVGGVEARVHDPRLEGDVPATPTANASRKPNAAYAAQEFESLFIKQILSHVDFGMKGAGVQAGMAVEALASGLARAGGLGMRAQIEAALSRSHDGRVASAPAAAEPKTDADVNGANQEGGGLHRR